MRLRRLLTAHVAAVAALVLGLTACESESLDADPVAGTQVTVVDNAFEPPVLQVEAGQAVTWRWEGDNPHDVALDALGSPVQRSGTYTHTFHDTGEVDYACSVHGRMSGRVVVVDP